MTYSKNYIIKELEENKEKILQFGVKKLDLFGSYSKNEQTESSDIDFLVEFYKEKKTFRNFMHLFDFLERTFLSKIELITIESVPDFMEEKIRMEADNVISC